MGPVPEKQRGWQRYPHFFRLAELTIFCGHLQSKMNATTTMN